MAVSKCCLLFLLYLTWISSSELRGGEGLILPWETDSPPRNSCVGGQPLGLAVWAPRRKVVHGDVDSLGGICTADIWNVVLVVRTYSLNSGQASLLCLGACPLQAAWRYPSHRKPARGNAFVGSGSGVRRIVACVRPKMLDPVGSVVPTWKVQKLNSVCLPGEQGEAAQRSARAVGSPGCPCCAGRGARQSCPRFHSHRWTWRSPAAAADKFVLASQTLSSFLNF